MRRLRRTPAIRQLVRETALSADRFVYPIFVEACADDRVEISSMPGQYRWPLRSVAGLARDVASAGIPAIMLFGLPESKDDIGSGAYDRDGIV
jgi:porphobilinogen synthase